jgi:hypothetical protein
MSFRAGVLSMKRSGQRIRAVKTHAGIPMSVIVSDTTFFTGRFWFGFYWFGRACGLMGNER